MKEITPGQMDQIQLALKTKPPRIIVFAISIIVLALIIIIYKSSNATNNNYDFNLSTAELLNDYKTNESRAQEKYKGKLIRISGVIESVNSGQSGEMIVNLKTDNALTPVKCYILKSDEQTAANYVKDKITLTGKGDGIVMGSPVIEDCVVLK